MSTVWGYLQSDTYALACVLYEMLVGEPPYLGNTSQAVLGKIIQGIPVSAMAVRQSVPVNVDAAIRKALEKLPADRFTRAQDFARALADPTFRHGVDAATTTTASAGPWKWVAAGMTAVAGIASVFAFSSVIGPESGRRIERFAVPFLDGQELTFTGMSASTSRRTEACSSTGTARPAVRS